MKIGRRQIDRPISVLLTLEPAQRQIDSPRQGGAVVMGRTPVAVERPKVLQLEGVERGERKTIGWRDESTNLRILLIDDLGLQRRLEPPLGLGEREQLLGRFCLPGKNRGASGHSGRQRTVERQAHGDRRSTRP